mmetsp:Transcript_62404/g.125012  ORF Transcript_62404/g.125012 Transcript_62404/m.125012 type:complete len:422 (+) Transcript_62404:184-1449(+)
MTQPQNTTMSPCIQKETEDHVAPRRTRRRRRRGGGKKKTWFDFAPRVTDSGGNILFADDDLGFPVQLPSGQGVYLLHEAINPEFAATYLSADQLRPAMPTSSSTVSTESESATWDCASTTCSSGDLTDDEDLESAPEHSALDKTFEVDCPFPAKDIDDDNESTFSDITAHSLNSLDDTHGCFRVARNDTSDSGVTSCSSHSSECVSTIGDSFTTASTSSSSLFAESAWKSFHECVNIDNCDGPSSFEPRKLPSGRRAAKLAAAARRSSSSCSEESDSTLEAWGGLHFRVNTPATETPSALPSYFSSSPVFLSCSVDETTTALVDRIIGGDEEVATESEDAVVQTADTKKSSSKEKREARRLAKAVESEATAKAERDLRRAAHEKRAKRNQAKAERRSKKVVAPAEDEVDQALRELGVSSQP